MKTFSIPAATAILLAGALSSLSVAAAKGPGVTLMVPEEEVLVLHLCIVAPIDDVLNSAALPCQAAGTLPSPSPSARPRGSPTPGANGTKLDGGGPDVLLLALLTVGASGGAAAIGLVGYAIRNRIGFWPHRPPQRDEDAGQEHH